MTKSNRELTVVQPNRKGIPAPLRYYDPELQNALNVEPFDEERFQQARSKAKQLHASYLEQLSKLRSRLSARAYARFTDEREPLFDSNLLEFVVGDSIGYAAKLRQPRRIRTSVQATFLSFDEKTLQILRYTAIEALNVNVPTERWFEMSGKHIDSLLADELTSVDSKLMQHSFLFASGSTISIQFEKMTWETKHARWR